MSSLPTRMAVLTDDGTPTTSPAIPPLPSTTPAAPATPSATNASDVLSNHGYQPSSSGTLYTHPSHPAVAFVGNNDNVMHMPNAENFGSGTGLNQYLRDLHANTSGKGETVQSATKGVTVMSSIKQRLAVLAGTDVAASWDKENVVHESRRGMFNGVSEAELRSRYNKVRKRMRDIRNSGEKVPHELRVKFSQLSFALRAKHGWKSPE